MNRVYMVNFSRTDLKLFIQILRQLYVNKK